MDWFGSLLGYLIPVILIVLFLVVPAMARRRQAAGLIAHFSALQRRRKSRLIAIVHREEGMGILGVPILRHIDLNDAEEVLHAIQKTPRGKPLEILLHTPGGLVLASLQIARAVKAHDGPVTVFVPHYAMSGGTLIALAADKIVMSPHASLGPVDPQIGGVPAVSVIKVTQQKPVEHLEDTTLLLADVGAKAIAQLRRAAVELLEGNVSPNAAVNIADELTSGRWTHDYPIDAEEAQDLGLNVSTDMPKEISQLMALFPPNLRRAPSVRTAPLEARKSGSSDAGEPSVAGLLGRRREEPVKPAPQDKSAVRVRMTGYEDGR